MLLNSKEDNTRTRNLEAMGANSKKNSDLYQEETEESIGCICEAPSKSSFFESVSRGL